MVMTKHARHICSTALAGRKFALSASTCQVPHHSHRLLHPLFGLLYRHHARAVWSRDGLHFLLHMAATQRLRGQGTGGQKTAERGGRGPLLPGRRKRARHPGAICGRTRESRISKRRLGDRKRCYSAVVHAPFLRFGDCLCAKKGLWSLEST